MNFSISAVGIIKYARLLWVVSVVSDCCFESGQSLLRDVFDISRPREHQSSIETHLWHSVAKYDEEVGVVPGNDVVILQVWQICKLKT